MRYPVKRRLIQLFSLIVTNLHISGWLNGSIYTGQSKMFCIPGLHCYSCPSSVLACPVGSIQNIVADRGFLASFTSGRADSLILLGILGFLMIIGFTVGRMACAYVCPFGFLQDLLYKLPVPKRSISASWSNAKYAILLIFVFLLPILLRIAEGGGGDPWFCKVICPAGTIGAGWPLVLFDRGRTFSPGFLFTWKSAVAFLIILWATTSKRPFCRVLCPLGAFWGLTGRASLFRMNVDSSCIECGKCKIVCPMDIRIDKSPSSMECIRCGECIPACPVRAISHKVVQGKK